MVENTPVTPPSAELMSIEPQVLTVEHAAKLFFHSFRHSQGSPMLQLLLFKFVAAQNPHWRISDREKEQIFQRVNAAILKYTDGENHSHTLSEDRVRIEIRPFLNGMQSILNAPEKNPKVGVLNHDISKLIIGRDFQYLTSPTGRPRLQPNPSIIQTDPWFSFICHYGLHGNPTGIPEFDNIYQSITDYIKDAPRAQKISTEGERKLFEIVDIHNAHHPDAQVHLDR